MLSAGAGGGKSGHRIPFYDLSPQHAQMTRELDEIWERYVGGAERYVFGESVERFEEEFAAFTNAEFCVTVGNGTDAIHLVLVGLGIGPGDEVIVPTNSFAATALAVVHAGATPVFADVEANSGLIDIASVAERLSPKTKAVIAVHLYGQLADVEALVSLLSGSRAVLIEDAAQAHGSTRHGEHPGCSGQAATTSFYPSKNLGAFGDGGAVVTKDQELAENLRLLRNYGSVEKYIHMIIGFNSRLDSLQAEILSKKLNYLTEWNKSRELAASYYSEALGSHEKLNGPITLPGNKHVWHLYVLRVSDAALVQSKLWELGVETGRHYPVPIHLQPAFMQFGTKPPCPIAETLAGQVLSLPLFPGITRRQQDYVVEALTAVLRD